MKKLMKSTVAALAGTMLTACAASPNVLKTSNGNEDAMSCAQIAYEQNTAEQAKKDAREHDKFEFRYMMPITAVMSVININKAESAAKKRSAFLDDISTRKGCTNSFAQNGAAPMGNNYAQAPQANAGIPAIPYDNPSGVTMPSAPQQGNTYGMNYGSPMQQPESNGYPMDMSGYGMPAMPQQGNAAYPMQNNNNYGMPQPQGNMGYPTQDTSAMNAYGMPAQPQAMPAAYGMPTTNAVPSERRPANPGITGGNAMNRQQPIDTNANQETLPWKQSNTNGMNGTNPMMMPGGGQPMNMGMVGGNNPNAIPNINIPPADLDGSDSGPADEALSDRVYKLGYIPKEASNGTVGSTTNYNERADTPVGKVAGAFDAISPWGHLSKDNQPQQMDSSSMFSGVGRVMGGGGGDSSGSEHLMDQTDMSQ